MLAVADIFWRVPLLDHLGPAATSDRHRTFRVGMLLAAVALLNLIDLICTLYAHSIGMLNEMNPLASLLLAHSSTLGLVVFKVVALSAGGAMLWRLRRCPAAQHGCWLLFSAYCGLTVLWTLWLHDALYALEVHLEIYGVAGAF